MTTINNKRSRNYVYTIPNYTKKDLEKFHKLAEACDRHRYICYGLEVGKKKGTPHIQGYIELKNAQGFRFLQKYFDFTRNKKRLGFHIEPAIGTVEQNYKYTKKEGKFFEFGTPKKQGKRTDLIEIKETLKKNPRELGRVVDEQVSNFQQLKFAENIRIYFFKHRDQSTPPKVLWIHGSTGIGKTRLVHTTFPDICSVSSCDWIGTGYEQNECLLFDDFRASDMKFNTLLNITDRYPFTVFFKGGQIPLNSPFIIFTSALGIATTFSFMRSDENLRQLQRRIIEIDLDEVGVDIDLRTYTDTVD